MNKHTLLTILLFLVLGQIIAQKVGINTTLPLSDLHIQGKLQVTKNINVGGTENTKGSSGTDGQVLKSNGKGKAPQWSTINIPTVAPGVFSLTATMVATDSEGLELEHNVTKRQYFENDDINEVPPNDTNAVWHPFKHLTTTVNIKDSKNKTNITLQTIGSIPQHGSSISSFSFGIGFFINDKLKIAKTMTVSGIIDTYEVMTVVATIQDLPIGVHTLKVAAIPRRKESVNGVLAIGRPNKGDLTLLSPFMTKTTLKIDSFEVLNH